MAELSSPAHRQDNLRGILFMLAGFFMFSIADTLAKVLTATYHPVQIVWTRQLGITTGVLLLLIWSGPSLLRSVAPGLQIARGLCAIVSAVGFVFALKYVPLADAVAVTFVAPFMVTVMAALLLGEKIGLRRTSAIAVGFLGTLVVIRPGQGVLHPAILFVILAAAAFAARQILSRYLGNRDRTETTMAYTALTSVALLAIPLPFLWQTPATLGHIGIMAAMAILAAIGEYMIIRALEMALAVVVAPMQYAMILFSSLWGFLVFGHIPDVWTWVGATIIIASGLYMMLREARLSAKPNP
ncbi:MAG: DMT family transporter [Paracoccaceae bacterium]